MSRWRPWQNPYDPPEPDEAPRMIVKPGGALIDPQWLEDEQARGAAFERSLAARRASREADQAAAIEQAERDRAAHERAIESELPPHLRPRRGDDRGA